MKKIIAKEIIIFFVGLFISITIYFSVKIFNSNKKENINQLEVYQINNPINNLNKLMFDYIKNGTFKNKEEFFPYITDTAFQQEFFDVEKNDFLKIYKDIKEFRHEYFLDSISSQQQFELAEKKYNEKKVFIKSKIENENEKIISIVKVNTMLLILVIIFYPLRLFLYAIIWAIKTLRKQN